MSSNPYQAHLALNYMPAINDDIAGFIMQLNRDIPTDDPAQSIVSAATLNATSLDAHPHTLARHGILGQT